MSSSTAMPLKPNALSPIVPGRSESDDSDQEDAYFSPVDSTSDSEDALDASVTGSHTQSRPADKEQSAHNGKATSHIRTDKETPPTDLVEASNKNKNTSATTSNTRAAMGGSIDNSHLLDDAMDVDPPQVHTNFDLLSSIKGMFRVLDLISESGSGGLVDKIIIAQESLKELINELSPGAYASLTKVNFKALDTVLVKPLGIYGSQSEIVDFLASSGAIDHETSLALRRPGNDTRSPHLRSGLYVLRTSNIGDSEPLFVIYWPDATTWNDDAISSVRRNRVTFLRYLTKLCDQVVCLISPEHARSIVWNDEQEEIMMELEDEGADRLFTFEVAKTNEQEEDVSVRPGFQMNAPILSVDPRHADCTVEDTEPTLVHGETALAILTKSFVPRKSVERYINGEPYNAVKLRGLLATGNIQFTPKVTDDDIRVLGEHGLESRFPAPFKEWKTRNAEGIQAINDDGKKEEQEELQKLPEESSYEPLIREAVLDQIEQLFPTVQRTLLSPVSLDELDLLRAQYTSLTSIHVELKDEISKIRVGGKTSNDKLERLPSPAFRALKDQINCLDILFSEKPDITLEDREEIINHVAENGVESLTQAFNLQRRDKNENKGLFRKFSSWFSSSDHHSLDQTVRSNLYDRRSVADGKFLTSLDAILSKEPLLQALIVKAVAIAEECLQTVLPQTVRHFAHRALFIQQMAIQKQIKRKSNILQEEFLRNSRNRFDDDYAKELARTDGAFIIDKLERSQFAYAANPFKITAVIRSHLEPALQCNLHPLYLTSDDQHTAQLDDTFVPTPHVSRGPASTFNLKLDHRILHAQLLEKDRLLLILADAALLYIYHESVSVVEHAISRGRHGAKSVFHRDKIGVDVIFAYDEQKRMLSLCSASSLRLHIYQFDETFTALQGWGMALDLRPWYTQGTTLFKSCFVGGCEELLFIDNGGQARIFSLITQQFRPASLSLDQLPETIQSTSDGACLIVSTRHGEKVTYQSFHWDTFGSSEGIVLGQLDLPNTPAILTSLVNRRNVHLVAIDRNNRVCRSVVLDIKKKVTEFMFKETGAKGAAKTDKTDTANNCLIEVHSEVWTRFPVVAAIQRQTVSSGSRRARQLLFVSEQDHEKYSHHFTDLIYGFEQRTRKPTGDTLKSIRVSAISPLSFYNALSTLMGNDLTVFKAGEWMVDLLCLIPIQIALTRDNRFLPLKDGVISAALERSLLGAEVSQIVDALSFGWFESVFQSYMTSKPVKVVSSMGEQSVGKSYTLNHLADTTFAGSAMRTTEGVWMSVTPTHDALIVALDFEGVHSIERSAQEDTLLVLFNTALSNLVLFRNNFAMSRSISGLFQSFQSSSTVLDPAANPSLFKSTLTIIIKDVVESDKKEIVREFSTKFQKIVEDEQDANFISRLHAGQLNIIPWPVIESKQFYALFPAIKRLLDRQQVTHRTAGEFLHTLKTLMAKLKANDWGALSRDVLAGWFPHLTYGLAENLAAHRAQKLLTGLNNALVFGFFEVDPEQEPLKNFDTDELIDMPDTESQFFLSDKESSASQREAVMLTLQNSWSKIDQRPHRDEAEWFDELVEYLSNLVDMRIGHVHKWISSNLARFTESQANMEMLRRVFETSIVDLRANVEICGTQCTGCQLNCLLSRHNQSVPHDCRTDHTCPHSCDFGDDDHLVETESKQCGLPAGHAGRHICAVDVHLCGEPCVLKDKPGCLGRCMKPAAHEGDVHQCTARVHKCGEPCSLKKIKIAGGKLFSCSKPCAVPSDEAHTEHVCDSSACPIACELCKRLCSETEHLHGLDENAVHLCGQTHNCAALCQSQGTCEIETAPQSIEATFTGRHETFQYTKYSQAAKRLQCVFPIPPGQKSHTGPHCHSADPAPFHFCETRCENCGYFCTLPRGHPQQEHETRHGSMSRTQWSVEGPEGTIIELNGRKFGASDEGSPLLCNLFCQDMGRHAHLDYCRASDAAPCTGPEVDHLPLTTRMLPHPDRAKDWISHSLFWKRSGFKDPYSRPDQLNFSKCDAMCPDTDHAGDGTGAPNPSYCTLPLFHPPATRATGLGYLSNDGHVFSCKNPTVLQNAFHVIFVIDRSGSMGSSDRRPLANTPSTALIARSSNNRLGAVYSALHGFWLSRNTALNAGAQGAAAAAAPARRDAYSVILFDHNVSTCIANDFTSTPDRLLDLVLPIRAGGGTNFTAAIQTAQTLMGSHWSTERTPVIIFLSDGECDITDETMRTLGRRAIALGKPLSFHSVSFGKASQSGYLRRMAQVALEVQNSAPRDPLAPAGATIESSYSEALDTVRLAETFLGFAESLRKPRGALVSSKTT